MWRDLSYAIRTLRRTPAFTLIAIATLAVGIGACTAVFSTVDRLLFRSLPYRHAEQLVSVGITAPIDTNEFMLGRSYVDWRREQKPFQSITSMLVPTVPGEVAPGACVGEQNPIRIHCISVEANFLSTLGIRPVVGHDLTREDDRPGAPRVGLISYSLWPSRFGGDLRIVDRTIQLNDQSLRIKGVLPRGFEMPTLTAADVLMPEQLDETRQRRTQTGAFLRVFARLKPGVSIERAREEMQPLFQQTLQIVPPELRGEVHLVVRSLRDLQIHSVRLASWLLLGTVIALLLIACSNIANLLLARAAGKRREIAMRVVLGAGRMRLARQSLTESLLLGLAGAGAGCALAWAIVRSLVAIAPDALVRLNQARIDLRVLAFTLLASILCAVLFGLAPALERPRAESLTGWHAAGPERGIFRQLLLTFQIAISLILLTGATLFARSLSKLETQPLGMQTEHIITASFVVSPHRYQQAAALDAFYREIESKLRSIPGVSAFALSDSIPPAGGMHARPYSNMRIAGHPPLAENGGTVAFRYVTPGYFKALGIHIVAGRGFSTTDRSSGQDPIILSETLARRMFGDQNPIGQQIALGGYEGARTVWSPVIGVAADVKNSGLAAAAEPEYYRVRAWNSNQLGHAAVAIFRTPLPLNSLAPWIRHEIAAIDPSLPVNIQSMHERIGQLSERPRFVTVLIGLFATCGLLLAAIGLFGVMSFLVNQRTREMGVRMAVGATPRDIMALVLKFAARWTALGVFFGVLGSLFLTRLTRGLLFETSPQDPVSFAIAAAVLLGAALVAAWLPSARASRVDPAISLRHE